MCVRQLASGERGDAPVDDGIGSREAEFEPAGDLVFECDDRRLRILLNGVVRLRSVVVA